MSTDEIPGRALATRRATAEIVRAATLGSYGVAGFEAGPLERVMALLAGRSAGIRVETDGSRLSISLRLRLATGLPIAEVARQVDSAVRHAVRRSLRREVDVLRIRIGGLEAALGTVPAPARARPSIGSAELADSGTDVA